jgi:hypothetical protein
MIIDINQSINATFVAMNYIENPCLCAVNTEFDAVMWVQLQLPWCLLRLVMDDQPVIGSP